jgi:hypothetical protein
VDVKGDWEQIRHQGEVREVIKQVMGVKMIVFL